MDERVHAASAARATAHEAVITPDWELPPNVHAFITTRHGGHSSGAYASFNLGNHVGDADDAVVRNRQLLQQQLQQRCGGVPLQLQWMNQVHGTAVHRVEQGPVEPPPRADAMITRQSGIVLNVLTADCLPVLFCSHDGSEIAVAHAGWRGLCNGVLEATLDQFSGTRTTVRCYLGPGIGPCHFEVGDEVRQAFLMLSRNRDQVVTKQAFTPAAPGKWMADLYALAKIRLRAVGVTAISGTPQCVVCNSQQYYSYRQQQITGRFATGIVRV